jgi:hypothetical protein
MTVTSYAPRQEEIDELNKEEEDDRDIQGSQKEELMMINKKHN